VIFFSDIPTSLLHFWQLVLPWRLSRSQGSLSAALPVLMAPLLSCLAFLLQELRTLPAMRAQPVPGRVFGCWGSRGKGLEGLGSAAPPLPVASELSLSSVSGWKGSRNGLDVGPTPSPAALGLGGRSDSMLMGSSDCGKLVLAGEHCCFCVHLHTYLCISSTPSEPASDPGWKAIGLAPCTLTPVCCPASLKTSPYFLSS